MIIGYPYYYGTENLSQDENFMIFSLDPIIEDSELNFKYLSSVPLIIEPSQFQFGDEFIYQFCNQISQICGHFDLVPQIQTLIIDYDGFCNLVSKSNVILYTISSNLGVTKLSAMEQAQKLFDHKNVVVQTKGIHVTIYKTTSYLQAAGSAGLVAHTLAIARIAGVNGFRILQAQPGLAIVLPMTGSLFFYGSGAIAENNTIGKALITTGDFLSLPMQGIEIMWNSYGSPVILNMTQTLKTGSGYTVKEIHKYIPLNKTSMLRSIKDKIINFLK